MFKLRIKYSSFFVVSSVLLIDDQKSVPSDVLFSLKHKAVDRFLDEDGDFCTGEKRIGSDPTQVAGEINLKPGLFSNVEEFDDLQILVYEGDRQLYSWTFVWPDNPGYNELEIVLNDDISEVDEPPVDEPPGDEPVGGTDGEPVGGDGGKPGGRDGGSGDFGEDRPPPRTPNPVWIKPVLAVIFASIIAAATLAYMIFEHDFFSEEFALLNQNSCTKSSHLISSMETDAKKSEFSNLCANYYSKMSEAEFNDIADAIIKENYLLLEFGKMYDVSHDDNFFRKMWPNTKTELPLAAYYYDLAKDRNIAGASELLKNACARIKPGSTDEFYSIKHCKGNP